MEKTYNTAIAPTIAKPPRNFCFISRFPLHTDCERHKTHDTFSREIPRLSTPAHAKAACSGDPGYLLGMTMLVASSVIIARRSGPRDFHPPPHNESRRIRIRDHSREKRGAHDCAGGKVRGGARRSSGKHCN